jgi:hypothetical protein
MHLGLFAAALAVSALTQNAASDWFHVDSASDHSNASFIDKASIHPNAAGNLEASMFTLLAAINENVTGYRFTVEFDCTTQKSRLRTAQTFDLDHKPGNADEIPSEWTLNPEGSQGSTITKFVCSRGASKPAEKSLGSALPWEMGRAFL